MLTKIPYHARIQQRLREKIMPQLTNYDVKPFLKWAGGKRQLLQEILPKFPDTYDCYFEPFIGAGAVLFGVMPKKAVINDYNKDLITTYQVIKDEPEVLLGLLKKHQEMNSPEYFYSIRELDRNGEEYKNSSSAEKAARTIYLNRTCFNGLYRVNSKGYFNVPYGKYKNPQIVNEEIIMSVSNYLNSNEITIMRGDFAASLKSATPNDFIYFDPPYHTDTNSFTAYQAGGFGEEEQIRLRDLFADFASKGIRCLLSNSDTAFIRDIYKDFKVETVYANRMINSKSEGRGKITEVLVKNWED